MDLFEIYRSFLSFWRVLTSKFGNLLRSLSWETSLYYWLHSRQQVYLCKPHVATAGICPADDNAVYPTTMGKDKLIWKRAHPIKL